MEVEELEAKFPVLIFQMYETISKIATENKIVKQEEEKSKDKIEFAVKTAMNLQNTLLTQNMNNQWNMKAFLSCMKEDIQASFGSALSQEIDTVLNNMSSNLEENFG